MKKKHLVPTKTGKAMSSVSTKMHKPSQKAFNKTMDGLEGEHRNIYDSPYTKSKRAKRLEGKSV